MKHTVTHLKAAFFIVSFKIFLTFSPSISIRKQINKLIALLPPKPVSDDFLISSSCESLLNLRLDYLGYSLNL
jgi:hypothetical protein